MEGARTTNLAAKKSLAIREDPGCGQGTMGVNAVAVVC
jgi:hypothetical protein